MTDASPSSGRDTPPPHGQGPAHEAIRGAQVTVASLDPKAMATGVYALFLATLLTGVTALAGVIIAYVMRRDAEDWLKSHYAFQIRTFWIGLAGAAIGTVLIPVLGLGFLVWVAVLLWFLVRSVAGLSKLLNNQPYPNPTGWLL